VVHRETQTRKQDLNIQHSNSTSERDKKDFLIISRDRGKKRSSFQTQLQTTNNENNHNKYKYTIISDIYSSVTIKSVFPLTCLYIKQKLYNEDGWYYEFGVSGFVLIDLANNKKLFTPSKIPTETSLIKAVRLNKGL
ncbi:unnamed protein product, partial [Didymodactylos carnosus]